MSNKMGQLSGKKKFSGLKKDPPYYPIFAKEKFRQKKDPQMSYFLLRKKSVRKVWESLGKFGQVWASLDKLGQAGTSYTKLN